MLNKTTIKYLFSQWGSKIPKHKVMIDPKTYRLAHPIWNLKEAENVEITHHQPKNLRDNISFYIMKSLRLTFDMLSAYQPGNMDENKYLTRFIFLETVAGVPGMVGAMWRHLKSLRAMQQDKGWIHHLLEEAENERMHLFTFLSMKKPGFFFKQAILFTQGIFWIGYGTLYLFTPKTAHRFVGYLEEEAVKTYTKCLEELDAGKLQMWKSTEATEEAKRYWGLPKDAKIRDVLIAVRADELMHRELNHHLSDINQNDAIEQHELEVGRWDHSDEKDDKKNSKQAEEKK